MENQAIALSETRTLGHNLIRVEHGGISGRAPGRVIENAVTVLALGIGVAFRVKNGIEVVHLLIIQGWT